VVHEFDHGSEDDEQDQQASPPGDLAGGHLMRLSLLPVDRTSGDALAASGALRTHRR